MGSSWSARLLAPVLAALVLLGLGAGRAVADPVYEGPLLYGLDPVLRATEDPRLLGVERLVIQRRLARLGVRPAQPGQDRPSLGLTLHEIWVRDSRVDWERLEHIVEYNGALGTMTEITYPQFLYLFPAKETLPGGFVYYPPRRTDDPAVELFVDDIESGGNRRHAADSRSNRLENLDRAGGGKRTQGDSGLINLTIPIKLPRTLERIIGRGEKTNIRISGRERISITGESSVTKPFLGDERIQSQSLFPSLDMEQELQVSLSGTIGEKIILEVDHNSAAIGPDATKISLRYEGDEDDIIQSIQTGDVGLTLPGGTLLGYSSSKKGLFGIKVEGQVGPADFTVVATKQKAESSSQSFNAKGGQVTSHEILSSSYYRNRFFRLTSDVEPNRIPMGAIDLNSIRVYKLLPGGEIQAGEVRNIAAYADTIGDWSGVDLNGEVAYASSRWRAIELNLDETSPYYALMADAENFLWGVDLGSDQGDDAVLAVTFTWNGGAFRVGDDPGQAATGNVIINGQVAEDLWYRMKLLKAPIAEPNPFAHGLMIRQIYPLGGAGIDPGSFNLRIEAIDPTSDTPQYNEEGIAYLQIFGLDNGDDYGVGVRDERPDLRRGRLFDLDRGLLIFPENFATPFAAGEADYAANASGTGFVWDPVSFLATRDASLLYEAGTLATDIPKYGYFRIVAEHASASNTISLGSSNIEEGSEVVKVDGKTLNRGEDYDIDYTFGEINLKEGNFTLTAESQISVTFSFAPFVGGGRTNLLGGNFGYELGRKSRVSTTWLYQTEAIVGEKAKLGEEPSKNLVGNINLQHTASPKFLTTIANAISRLNTERESSLQIQGEVAMNLPNPNTKGQVYLEDFEGVDASDLVSLVRTAWFLPSFPLQDTDGVLQPDTTYTPTNRVNTIRWHRPKDRVPRWYLNPDLVNQEREESQTVMELYMHDSTDDAWGDENWGGIMRGMSASGLDLTKAQFLEVWVNDGMVERDDRSGRIHLDFGLVSEDGYWPGGEVGTEQDEDANRDGNFTQVDSDQTVDEDTGLGDITDIRSYSAELDEDTDTYPYINSTRKNLRWDREDANNNGFFDLKNEYFTAVIDLKDTETLVDVVEDYTGVQELRANGHAWRKYRIPLSDVLPVTDRFDPELTRVKQFRLWFEDDDRSDSTVRLQLSELRFLGSRWERNGVRRLVDETILGPGDLEPGEGFFLGEVNNKENPDYVPPYQVHEELNIPEKEQALVIDYANLAQGHMVMASRQVSAQGDDYTGYEQLGWFWNNTSHATADLDLFFRVGADTLNYYEVNYKFADTVHKTGWKSMILDIAELSNVKNGTLEDDGTRTGTVTDARSGHTYKVRVKGRPDLRTVKRYYFVIANNDLSYPATGQLYLNDVRLLGVKREPGMAERGGVRLNMADVIKVDFDWSHQDQEYHGLNTRKGTGIDSESWNLSTNFKIQDFVPLLGFRLPVGLSRRQTIKRPKYELNSDIEIVDSDVRNELSTIETRDSFTLRLSHPGSKNALLRYVVDPWSFNLNGSESTKLDPLVDSFNKSLQGGVKYDLRIPGQHRLAKFPILKSIPVVKAVRFLPTHVSGTAGFTSNYRANTTITADGERRPRAPSRTRPMNMDASIDYKPLQVMDISASGKSERDMLRPSELAGVNIGQENRRSYSTRLILKPPLAKTLPRTRLFSPVRAAARGIAELRPSIQFKGAFGDNHGPDVAQGDDPHNVRSIGNNGSWEFRFSLPVGDVTKKVFPKRKLSDQQRQRMLQEQEALEARASRRGGKTPEEGAGVELTPEETAGKTPEEIVELREQRLLEAAQAREEEEAAEERRRKPLTADEAGIPNPLDIVLESLRNMTPVKFTLTDKRTSNYNRYRGDVPFWFKTGLMSALDRPDSLYAAASTAISKSLSIAVTTKMHRYVSLDLKFNQGSGEKDNRNSITENFKQDWPDARVSVSGLERWPILGGNTNRDEAWFTTSSVSVSYKKSRFANGSTPDYYTPTTQTSFSPRWSATLQSGMSIAANVNIGKDRQVHVGSAQESSSLGVSMQIRHQFRAQAFLARMGLYRPGSNPSITMDVDVGYGRDRSVRIDQTGGEGSQSGTNRMSLNPRFSYNITRNLTGALRFIYNRSGNVQSGQTTTTLGMGLEATFVF